MAKFRLSSRSDVTALLIGLVSAGLAALAGSQSWYVATGYAPLRAVTAGEALRPIDVSVSNAPSVAALALVGVALWVAALVGRRWINRLVGTFLVLLSAGMLIAGLITLLRVPQDVHVNGGWPWLALIGALLSMAAAVGLTLFTNP